MKKLLNVHWLLYATFMSIILIYTASCSSEQVSPTSTILYENQNIEPRSGCTGFGDLVRERVSERDHIPLQEIYVCTYYGPYLGAYCEYHCTTSFYGTPVYIIGDDSEGW